MSAPTKATIDRRISYLRGLGISIDYDRQVGGYRLRYDDHNRYISPRLPLKGAIDWLEAFENGVEMGKELQFNKMRKEMEAVCR